MWYLACIITQLIFFLEEDGLESKSSLPPCLTTADLSDFKQHMDSLCANF